jgi:hypothetical protein
MLAMSLLLRVCFVELLASVLFAGVLHVVASGDRRRSMRPHCGLRLRRDQETIRPWFPGPSGPVFRSVHRSPCTLSVGGERCSVVDRAGASWFKVHRRGAPPAWCRRRLCVVVLFAARCALCRRASRRRVRRSPAIKASPLWATPSARPGNHQAMVSWTFRASVLVCASLPVHFERRRRTLLRR